MSDKYYTFAQLNKKYGWNKKADKSHSVMQHYAEIRGVKIKYAFTRYGEGAYYQLLQDNSTLKDEDWKFNQKYGLFVSNLGRIKTTDKKFCSLHVNDKSYVTVSSPTLQKPVSVHRVVAETFIPIDNMENLTVDHIDGNRQNNQVFNLRWTTMAKNIKNRDENQKKIHVLVAQLINKYGYQQTFNKIHSLLQ